jgi:hypothetical protein
MADTNPQNSMEAEGIPELEDSPPGHDVDLDEDGLFAPRDRSVAAEGRAGHGVTAAEQRTPETVAERAAREQPDPLDDPAGRAARYRRDVREREAGLTSEEAAVNEAEEPEA